jgi:hypothetical protein
MKHRALLNLIDILSVMADEVLSVALDILKRLQIRVLTVRVKVSRIKQQTTE